MVLRFIIFSMSIFVFGKVAASYTESGVSFEKYLELAKEKAGEAISIQHPAGQTGYMTSCSGVLLNPWTVLTAAHCVTDENLKLLPNPDQYILGYGKNRSNPNFVFSSKTAIVHPAYNTLLGGGRINDIAVILLAQPFYGADQYVQFANRLPDVGKQVIAYGYGLKGDDKGIISSSDPSLNPNDPFLIAYQSILEKAIFNGQPSLFEMSFDRKLDLGGNAAQGDSGGGVEDMDGKLIGIISSISVPQVGEPSTSTQASNITTPQMQEFISKNWVTNTFQKWTGTGNVSDKSNWEHGNIPQNGSMHYYIPVTEGKKMVVDQYFKVDGVEMSHPDASFVVTPGVKASFEAGLTIIKASAQIDGGMDSGSLIVKDGAKYVSPEQINLFQDGYVFLKNGTIETKFFSMQGGHLSGNGSILTTSFTHTDGIISPSQADKSGGMRIQGNYRQTGDKAGIYIRLFQNGESDYLEVDQNKSPSLHFLLDFPDKILIPGSKYPVLKSSGGVQTVADFSMSSLYKASGGYNWEGGVLSLNISSFSLGVMAAEDVRQVYKSFQNLRASGGFIPSSVFDKIRGMSHTGFFKSLRALSNPYIEKDLHKTLGSTFLYEKYQGFRTTMFLEKEHRSFDLRHFSFHGVNGFSGDDVLVNKVEHSPSSFYISGNVYEAGSKYITDGLMVGWDFASGNELSGIGFYFRNKSFESSSKFEQYQLDITKVHRGDFTFLDYKFGTGLHNHKTFSQDEWGNWAASACAKQTTLQSRVGFHHINQKYMHLGYVGLSGAYTVMDNMKSVSQDLEVHTKDYSGVSLNGKVGLESKLRLHMENVVFEPWLQVSATIPFYENMQTPSHTLFGVESTKFHSSGALQNSGNIAISGGIRLGIKKNMMISLEGSNVNQQNNAINKMALNAHFRF